ncbi:MAG TPA: hypothetical protein VFG69_02515 [Nannocystaceae bacterium]|nr:hypothetical protein [Nannocystaceae bacterium]
MTSYLAALAVTLAVEVPIVALAFPKQRAALALAAAIATTTTHLAMHSSTLPGWSPPLGLLAAEIAATASEAVVYAVLTRQPLRAAIVAIVANVASFALGLLVL